MLPNKGTYQCVFNSSHVLTTQGEWQEHISCCHEGRGKEFYRCRFDSDHVFTNYAAYSAHDLCCPTATELRSRAPDQLAQLEGKFPRCSTRMRYCLYTMKHYLPWKDFFLHVAQCPEQLATHEALEKSAKELGPTREPGSRKRKRLEAESSRKQLQDLKPNTLFKKMPKDIDSLFPKVDLQHTTTDASANLHANDHSSHICKNCMKEHAKKERKYREEIKALNEKLHQEHEINEKLHAELDASKLKSALQARFISSIKTTIVQRCTALRQESVDLRSYCVHSMQDCNTQFQTAIAKVHDCISKLQAQLADSQAAFRKAQADIQKNQMVFSDHRLCRACYANSREVVHKPCNHVLYCHDCWTQRLNSIVTSSCDFCNKRITQSSKLLYP